MIRFQVLKDGLSLLFVDIMNHHANDLVVQYYGGSSAPCQIGNGFDRFGASHLQG
jgi:hypothetical protein